jgi:hypothetical protein
MGLRRWEIMKKLFVTLAMVGLFVLGPVTGALSPVVLAGGEEDSSVEVSVSSSEGVSVSSSSVEVSASSSSGVSVSSSSAEEDKASEETEESRSKSDHDTDPKPADDGFLMTVWCEPVDQSTLDEIAERWRSHEEFGMYGVAYEVDGYVSARIWGGEVDDVATWTRDPETEQPEDAAWYSVDGTMASEVSDWPILQGTDLDAPWWMYPSEGLASRLCVFEGNGASWR